MVTKLVVPPPLPLPPLPPSADVVLHAPPVTQMNEHQASCSPCGSVWVFSLADKCSRYHHGCWAGVCHPAQHNGETAFWPGTLGTTVKQVLWHAGVCVWLSYSLVCLDSEDDRAEGDLVLWPPVSGQQRFLHLAQAEQEGEENVSLFIPSHDITQLPRHLDLNEDVIMLMLLVMLLLPHWD